MGDELPVATYDQPCAVSMPAPLHTFSLLQRGDGIPTVLAISRRIDLRQIEQVATLAINPCADATAPWKLVGERFCTLLDEELRMKAKRDGGP